MSRGLRRSFQARSPWMCSGERHPSSWRERRGADFLHDEFHAVAGPESIAFVVKAADSGDAEATTRLSEFARTPCGIVRRKRKEHARALDQWPFHGSIRKTRAVAMRPSFIKRGVLFDVLASAPQYGNGDTPPTPEVLSAKRDARWESSITNRQHHEALPKSCFCRGLCPVDRMSAPRHKALRM